MFWIKNKLEMVDSTMADGLTLILNYLNEERGFDFNGYHQPMLERRIRQRLTSTACNDFNDYLSFIQENSDELDHLLDVLTINVSRFFRDPLTFELIAERILPAIIQKKIESGDLSLRVWSAGCAKGEEPYSIAIIINKLLGKEDAEMSLHFFATDIDSSALKDAEKAVYSLTSIENIKHRLLMEYFIKEGTSFKLIPEIRKLVTFAHYDMLDKRHGVPPESVFGNFDLVLCRNLLIYFNTEYQETILKRLYHSLTPDGYLILGEAEAPAMTYRHHFSRIFDFNPIYRKK